MARPAAPTKSTVTWSDGASWMHKAIVQQTGEGFFEVVHYMKRVQDKRFKREHTISIPDKAMAAFTAPLITPILSRAVLAVTANEKSKPKPTDPYMDQCEECDGTGESPKGCVSCGETLTNEDVDKNPEAEACMACVKKEEDYQAAQAKTTKARR